MKFYLSGPMSGIPEHNFPAFHAEAARLRAAGYEVVNPAEMDHASGALWDECLRKDIVQLVTCEGIALMIGWEDSRGAKLEFHIAKELGMHVALSRELF